MAGRSTIFGMTTQTYLFLIDEHFDRTKIPAGAFFVLATPPTTPAEVYR